MSAPRCAGWDYPASRELLAAMDLYDLQHHVAWAQGGGKGRKPDPYPRPWPRASKRQMSPDKGVTQEQVLAALRFAGHEGPVPTR